MPSTRREFLRLASAACATAAVTRRLDAAAADTTTRRALGFSLYGMKALPILDAIDHVARIGYRQVELSLLPGFPTEPARFSAASRREVAARVRDRGLELASLMLSLNLAADERGHAANLEAIRRAGELAHQLDHQRPPLLETVGGGKTEAWDGTRDQLAARLHAWGEAAGSGGVTLCVKGHVNQAANTPERLLWLYRAANHPRIKLNYDYSHYQFAGCDLEESLRALLPHTRYIHVKDIAPGEKPVRFLIAGQGAIDYAKYFRFLDELRYTGPVVAEISSQLHNRPGYDGVQAAEQAYAALSGALPARS